MHYHVRCAVVRLKYGLTAKLRSCELLLPTNANTSSHPKIGKHGKRESTQRYDMMDMKSVRLWNVKKMTI